MRKLMGMLVCAAVIGLCGQSTQAAQLSMSGTVVAPVAELGMPFSFVLDYTGAASTSTAVTGGVLQVGSHVWNTVLGGTGASIAVVGSSLQISVQFAGPSSPGPLTGTAVTFLSFTIAGPSLGPNATEANINSIRNGATAASGSLIIIPNAPFSNNTLVLQGTTVPEPASVGLLLAIGAVAGGRRYLRRRSAVVA
ncbi:MAG: PEP-CTERM sorting domain-containing protein [Planctomycetaceae bacterium]